MDLINFVKNVIVEGVASGVTYDALKKVLGNSFENLKNYLINDEIDKFQDALWTLLEEHEELKNELSKLQKEHSVNIIIQNHSGNGDNIGGNKIINN